MASDKPKFGGTTINLQTGPIIIPSLNFGTLRKNGALKKLDNVFQAFKGLENGDSLLIDDNILEEAIDLVFMAAERNYPNITRESIEDGLDFDSFMKIIPLLLTQNSVPALQNNGKMGNVPTA